MILNHGETMNTKTNSELRDGVYICLHLRSERLTPPCRYRLTAMGVECLSEGPPYRAYAIVDCAESILEELAMDPEISLIEQADPPSGM